jgi:glycerol uptake facilitator protein
MGFPAGSLRGRCGAEALGTFILVFLGCGAVHAAVLTEAQSGLWQVAIVWSVAVILAVYVVGGISGAHINPAITTALAAWGRFPWGDVGPYVLAQTAGAFVAAACLFGLFGPQLAAKEQEKQVQRGQPGSEITAMCYGEYFPNPGTLAGRSASEKGSAIAERLQREYPQVPHVTAFATEALATALLALVVFALTDPRNTGVPPGLAPVFIGLTVAVLISVVAPLTQACFNPARDFGPRLFAFLAGWGAVALPGPRSPGFFTVYILAPITGAVAAGGLWTLVLGPLLVPSEERTEPT